MALVSGLARRAEAQQADPAAPQAGAEAGAPVAPTMPGAESPVMTVDELAALLRVNRKTAYDAIARGEIPGVRRVGRTFRVSREAVVAWLREGRVSRSRRY